MPGRGVLFAIEDEELGQLGEAETDDDVLRIVESIEARWSRPLELDRAWDTIHRVLSDAGDGERGRRAPLRSAILGGTVLVDDERALVTVKGPDEVTDIARALAEWNAERFRRAYLRLHPGDHEEDELVYCLAWFDGIPSFYAAAARTESAVLLSIER